MIGGIQNIGRIRELRSRILFTFGMLAVYRMGCAVATPGINTAVIQDFFQQASGTVFGLMNIFSGGAMEQLSILALGIMPYISASIIFQLLTVVIPQLEQLKKEGEAGQKKITQCKWTALNKQLIVGDELGMIRLLDPVSGEVIKAVQGHTGRLNELRFNQEKTLYITGASDNLAKLWDAQTLECLCTYETEVPVNGVDISPIKEHVVLGGGQDAMEVTTTSTTSRCTETISKGSR